MAKGLENLVTRMLEADPQTRNSDMQLMLACFYDTNPDSFFNEPNKGWSVSVDSLKALHTKNKMESITRARRKIVNKRPDLQATDEKIRKQRRQKAVDVRESINDNDWERDL